MKSPANLTVSLLQLRKEGRAIEAGMRVNDQILQINDTPADDLTLMEACEMIRESGKHLRIYVRGDGYTDPEAVDYTVTMWYRIREYLKGGVFVNERILLVIGNIYVIFSSQESSGELRGYFKR